MIAKYKRPCAICGTPITPYRDIYDTQQQKSFHLDCQSKTDLFGKSEAEQLADRLGYIPASTLTQLEPTT